MRLNNIPPLQKKKEEKKKQSQNEKNKAQHRVCTFELFKVNAAASISSSACEQQQQQQQLNHQYNSKQNVHLTLHCVIVLGMYV